MADITISVNNINTVSLTNNEVTSIEYVIEKLSCRGNTLSYTDIQSDNTVLPSGTLSASTTFEFSVLEDNLYRITIDGDEFYYFRATSNIEACQRSLIRDIQCGLDKCDKLEFNTKISKERLFDSYKTPLYAILNKYQQEQSVDSLLSPDYYDLLTICQYFCQLQDLCGCIETKSYSTVLTDCGCSK